MDAGPQSSPLFVQTLQMPFHPGQLQGPGEGYRRPHSSARYWTGRGGGRRGWSSRAPPPKTGKELRLAPGKPIKQLCRESPQLGYSGLFKAPGSSLGGA